MTTKSKKSHSIVLGTEEVPIDSLRSFHKNPRKGSPEHAEAISESLMTHGQYKPLTVNRGTKTGRPSEILVGNHTWAEMGRLGWPTVLVSWVDVDDTQAAKLVAVDNRIPDMGSYDERVLAELLRDIPDLTGTAYKPGDIDALLASVDIVAGEAAAAVERVLDEAGAVPLDDAGGDDDREFGEEDNSVRPAAPGPGEELGPTMEKASDELKGAFQLKTDLTFAPADMVGDWGIPRLREDMLMQPGELPDNLEAWAGSATKEWPDPDQWWLYNFGVDSTSGMRDLSKVIVSFFCYDDYFDTWWWNPERQVSRMLNSGIKFAVTPDFSVVDPAQEPRVNSLWSLYRQRYLGRYMQEAGIKVIPNVTWAMNDEPFLVEHVLPTLPRRVPLLALQMQAVLSGDKKAAEHEARTIAGQYQTVLDTVRPDCLLAYHGEKGRRLFEDRVEFAGEVRWVRSRLERLSEQAGKREKKTTL